MIRKDRCKVVGRTLDGDLEAELSSRVVAMRESSWTARSPRRFKSVISNLFFTKRCNRSLGIWKKEAIGSATKPEGEKDVRRSDDSNASSPATKTPFSSNKSSLSIASLYFKNVVETISRRSDKEARPERTGFFSLFFAFCHI